MTGARHHSELLSLLKEGDVSSFEAIYNEFASRLYQYIVRRVGDREASEEMVQEIFVALWNRREALQITSLEGYLFTAAKYNILTFMRSERVRRAYAVNFRDFVKQRLDNSSEELMDLRDLQLSIESSLSQLPEKCQTVFRLSRMEHESIPEIAARMNISRRTVENYLSQALKHLRTRLTGFLSVLMALIAG